ncbi:uncharacterized protein [Aristolochia californica]|uniref:uncharacterized protein isoform X1 n=1 Tax=Aristolochia californica TaxID=171875 RepID=UPI0035D53F84
MEEPNDPISRPLGTTEQNWVRAVVGGTGITVLALLLSPPPDLSLLRTAIHGLQNTHPILRSSLSSSSVYTPPPSLSPLIEIESFSLASTSDLLHSLSSPDPPHLPFLHLLLERELNRNPWSNSTSGQVLFTTHYELPNLKSVLVLRLHTVACDRTSAVAMLKELPEMLRGAGAEWDEEKTPGLAVESMIPTRRGDKPFWARGLDLVGYSLNTMRWAHLEFQDVGAPRCTEVIRMQMGAEETRTIVEGCKARGIKLCGALAAAGLIAAYSSKFKHPDVAQTENYSIVTLVDCRKLLDPVLDNRNLGFYHSAILNTHSISKGEKLWDVAARCYNALSNSIDADKHFKDMGELNFLMCKAMDNPGFTPSGSLRTSFMVLFEDPVIEDGSLESCSGLGLEDYMGCSSIHGVGPSMAVFDTIRDGRLDCACVYPSPLHSRKQMMDLVGNMKNVLISKGE